MRTLIILLLFLVSCVAPKKCCSQINDLLKFSTVYGAANGGTSLSDQNAFNVNTGQLVTDIIETPFDYSVIGGIRKIKLFQYEDQTRFKDGTETSFNDAATIGRLKGFEYLFQLEYKRQEGIEYLDQHHFVRYLSDKWIAKIEYLQDGVADIEYFESSQRLRIIKDKKISFNIGAVQRVSEPYGFDPLEEWLLSNGNLHYTYLALQEGYNVDVFNSEYTDPQGNVVATSPEVWEEIVIPQVLYNYVEKKRNELPNQWQHSLVLGFDYYHYEKNYWLHAWGNLMPYHYDDGSLYSYHRFQDGDQWYDYSGGIIFGQRISKNLGTFIEGKYNKYWNKEWYDFKIGVNYKIF